MEVLRGVIVAGPCRKLERLRCCFKFQFKMAFVLRLERKRWFLCLECFVTSDNNDENINDTNDDNNANGKNTISISNIDLNNNEHNGIYDSYNNSKNN